MKKRSGSTPLHIAPNLLCIGKKFIKKRMPYNKTDSTRFETGFTLLEMLLVVAAIGILAGIVILALNPNKQLGDTRNAQRWSDVNSILNAIYQYQIDSEELPPAITTTQKEICISSVATSTCNTAGHAPLDEITSSEKYLIDLPEDPQNVQNNGIGYEVVKSDNDRVTVTAPYAEQGETIEVSR